jgi:5-methylcytosine-specific restriction endonuclease McrA
MESPIGEISLTAERYSVKDDATTGAYRQRSNPCKGRLSCCARRAFLRGVPWSSLVRALSRRSGSFLSLPHVASTALLDPLRQPGLTGFGVPAIPRASSLPLSFAMKGQREGRFTCQYCAVRFATEDLTFDHVLPRSRGGATSWENIVTCCIACNAAKADRTPEEAHMKLRRRPRRPTFLPSITVRMGGEVPAEWRPYWSGELQS